MVKNVLTPSVAVIIPTFNRWPYVCAAIDSVLSQSYEKTQCIVVDDASTDSSASLLQKKYGSQIMLISNPVNKGQSFSRNTAAQASTTDYVCFLDSDDVLEADSIKNRIKLFLEDSAFEGVSFGLTLSAGRKKHPLKSEKELGDVLSLNEYCQDHRWLHTSCFLITARCFISKGMFNTLLSNKEDIELFLRLLSCTEFRFCGQIVSRLRDLGDKRIRNDYDMILSQQDMFYRTITENTSIMEQMEPRLLHRLHCSEDEDMLRALYKLGSYRDFRSLYRTSRKNGYIHNSGRFYKRYLLSYLKGLFQQF